MKYVKLNYHLVVIFLVFAQQVNAQKIAGRLELIECANAEDVDVCFYEKTGLLFKEELKPDMISSMMKNCNVKDTLHIDLNFYVNEEGKVDQRLFRTNFQKQKDINDFLLKTLQSKLLFKTQVNECNKPLISGIPRTRLRYVVKKDEGSSSLELLPYLDPEEYDVFLSSAVNIAPKHKKCKSLTSNKALKDCLSAEMKLHISKKFSSNVLRKLKGTCTTRIYIGFKIDKKGKIVDVTSIGSNPTLEKEGIRLVKKFPKVIPGKHKGKPVGVLYSIPIVISKGG